MCLELKNTHCQGPNVRLQQSKVAAHKRHSVFFAYMLLACKLHDELNDELNDELDDEVAPKVRLIPRQAPLLGLVFCSKHDLATQCQRDQCQRDQSINNRMIKRFRRRASEVMRKLSNFRARRAVNSTQ